MVDFAKVFVVKIETRRVRYVRHTPSMVVIVFVSVDGMMQWKDYNQHRFDNKIVGMETVFGQHFRSHFDNETVGYLIMVDDFSGECVRNKGSRGQLPIPHVNARLNETVQSDMTLDGDPGLYRFELNWNLFMCNELLT